MDINQAQQWIDQLGRQLGIAGMALDKDGVCTLGLDGRWIVVIGHHAGEGGLRLMLCIDDLLPTPDQLARLMKAHFAWRETAGISFALSADGALVLQQQVSDTQLSAVNLADTLAALVDAAENWVARLSAPAEPGEPVADIDVQRFGVRA
jgi:hypothetical protein